MPTRNANEAWCCGCKDFRLKSEFAASARRKNGLNSWCKDCQATYELTYLVNRREARRKGNKWFWRNKVRRNDLMCSPEEMQQKYSEDPCCHFCAVSLLPSQIHIDHLTPRSRGGSDTIENLVVACADCNRLKWTRTESEFLSFLSEYGERLVNKGQGHRHYGQAERLNEVAPQNAGDVIVRSHGNNNREIAAEMTATAVPEKVQ